MTGKFVAAILTFALILTLTCSISLVEKDDAHAASSAIIVPDQYSTIQEAINNAVDGDTIFVKAGTYYEHVVVNKTVSLVGEDCSTTIVDGNGTGCVINILRDKVKVTGFTVQRGQFGIYVQNSRYTEIFNNTIAHNYGIDWDAGVRLEYADYAVIRDNEIFDNWRGILLYVSSPYVSVYRNDVTSNEYGIRVAQGGSSYVNVSGNRVTNNRGYGIDVTGFGGVGESNYVTIARNLVVNNTYEAVGLGEGSNYNTVVQNNMIENGHAGVTLERYSNYNIVVQNNLIGNAYGICFDLFIINSTQNTILNNNMINNTQQVRIVSGSVNAWNGSYASGGNYWSDYSGLDQFSGPYQNVTGSDGIGDGPYVIDANNRDGYPLMDLWRPNACDWIVDDDGFADFDTIQEAINGAFDGDSIFVKAGTYYEHVVVDKTVTLVGEDVTATVIDGNETGRVIGVVSDNVNITGFTVQRSGSTITPDASDLDAGIFLNGVRGCTISGNNIVDNGCLGIHLLNSEQNAVSGNDLARSTWFAIVLTTSNNNIISSNIVTFNPQVGIGMHASSHNNIISENTVINNTYGINLNDVGNSTISSNNLANNSEIGIWMQTSAVYSTVCGNNITGSRYGFFIEAQANDNTISQNNITMNDYGFYIESPTYNYIYHNNVLNNTQQTYVALGSVNLWDDGYPSGGNYWSDYDGLDADGDGIGDTQYDIDVYNVDRYPLINPWARLLGDINDDGTVDIFDAGMLATAFGSTVGCKNWMAEADLNWDSIIDIYDAIILSLNFRKQRT